MSRWIADVLLAIGVVAVIVTGYLTVQLYHPGEHTFSMGPLYTLPLWMFLTGWAAFVLSLVGLVAMWRIWRRS